MKELFSYTDEKLKEVSSNFENTFYFNSQSLYNVEETIFSDDFHFIDDYGYELLSEKIAQIIIDNKLLKKNDLIIF